MSTSGAEIPALVRGFDLRHAQQRCALRHAVPGKDVDAQRERLPGEGLRQFRTADHHLQTGEIGVRRRGRAKQHLQDRRHAVREGDALGLDQLEQHSGIVATRIHLLDAGKRRSPRQPPGMCVEHRGDRHVDVVAAEPALLRRSAEKRHFRERMKNHLPMAEIDALRRARRPGRVKGGGNGVFIEVRKVMIR
jgi:hypothetical protein